MMSGDARQSFLKLILPALVIGCGYAVFHGAGLHKTGTQLETDLANARSREPSDLELTSLSAREGELRARLDSVSVAIAERERAQPATSAALLGERRRTEVLAALTRLVAAGDLALEASRPRPRSNLGRVPSRLLALGRRVGAAEPGLWEVRVVGSYPAVQEALARLADSGLGCIPLGLRMEPNAAGLPPSWTWLLWM